MRFTSLFAGIGSFDLGFSRAGMVPVAQVEIDGECRGILRRHFPQVMRYDDVETTSAAALGPVDLLCGGFPCQDVSLAGRRAGLAGARSGLWFRFHQLIGDLRPRWVVIENVPGLRTSNAGRDLATVLFGLGELGYRWAYRSLDAQYDGVAQRRERLFIVGHLGGDGAARVLFEPESGAWDSAPRRQAREGAAAGVADGPGVPGVAGLIPDLTPTITSKWAKSSSGPAGDEGGNLIPVLAHTLRAKHGLAHRADVDTLIAFSSQDYGQDATRDLAPTLRAMGHDLSRPNGGGQVAVSTPAAVRRLTPRECERLFGFPDDWTAVDDQGQLLSNSARYRMLGNSIAVPTVAWLGRRIVAAHERLEP